MARRTIATTTVLAAVVAGYVVTMLLASTIPLALGDRTFVVRSGSMSPVIDTGDVVAVTPIAPADARVGDIVTFDNHGRLTSHRVRSMRRAGRALAFTTQGDANTGQERWRVPATGRIGRVTYRVPRLGFVIVQLQSTPGRLILVVLPALLLGVAALRRIWRGAPHLDLADAPAS